MDDTGLTCTPAKAYRSIALDDDNDASSSLQSKTEQSCDDDAMLVSPAISYLARKSSQLRIPPALNTKPRKANSLFGKHHDHDDDHDSDAKIGSKSIPAVGERPSDAGKSSVGESTVTSQTRRTSSFGEQLNTTTATAGSGESDCAQRADMGGFSASQVMGLSTATAGSFTSPSRPPRGETAVGTNNSNADRFTPQRNLGGLFLSPCPKDRSNSVDDMAPTSPTMMLVIPPLRCDLRHRSPEREQEKAEELAAPAAGAMPLMAVAAEPSLQIKLPVNDAAGAAETAPAWEEGRDKSEEGKAAPEEEVLVSNEALRAVDSKDICTLEVLVRHKRDRVGVSALSSWRVSELKRRLVYLKFFPSVETISLKARFGHEALADDQGLATLDTDMTYEARKVAVAPL